MDPDSSTLLTVNLAPNDIGAIITMLVLVILSAYFSATETAFSTFNRIRLKNMAENGSKRAALVLRMTEDYDKLLSTILVGNNMVNILLTTIATTSFIRWVGEGNGPAAAMAVTTVVVLIFGEISPKSLAKQHADKFTLNTVRLLRLVTWLLYPVNFIFSLWKKLLRLVFKDTDEQTVTEEEILTIVDEAEQGGSLDEQESEMIRSVIAFNDREAVDILIPRVDVAAVPVDATSAQLAEAFLETGFSRLPVYDDTIDRVVGVVYHKDYYRLQSKKPTPAKLMKPAVFVPPTVKIRLLLKQLQEAQSHIAIVTDEYGGTLGIVTLEDILEELVGEIWDEHDDVVQNILPQSDGSAVVLCSTELIDLMDHFGTETECDATTVSGWVMEAMGCIPLVGDVFDADGLSVRVTRVEKTRPDEILVWKLPETEEG